MLTPDTANAAILFLIQAGSLAASELQERWKLRRKKDEKVYDISDQTGLENNGAELLARLSEEINVVQIDHTRELIIEKQKRIMHWKRAKVLAEKDLDIGRISSDVFVAKKEDLDERIHSMMNEIEKDLLALGLVVEKESL